MPAILGQLCATFIAVSYTVLLGITEEYGLICWPTSSRGSEKVPLRNFFPPREWNRETFRICIPLPHYGEATTIIYMRNARRWYHCPREEKVNKVWQIRPIIGDIGYCVPRVSRVLSDVKFCALRGFLCHSSMYLPGNSSIIINKWFLMTNFSIIIPSSSPWLRIATGNRRSTPLRDLRTSLSANHDGVYVLEYSFPCAMPCGIAIYCVNGILVVTFASVKSKSPAAKSPEWELLMRKPGAWGDAAIHLRICSLVYMKWHSICKTHPCGRRRSRNNGMSETTLRVSVWGSGRYIENLKVVADAHYAW